MINKRNKMSTIVTVSPNDVEAFAYVETSNQIFICETGGAAL